MRRAVALLAIASLAGCASMSNNAQVPSLDGTSWVLSSLHDRPLLPGSPPTLRFEGGKAVGSDGCNRYSAAFDAQGGTFAIAPGISTQMACPPDTMEQAREYMNALASAKGYTVGGGNLSLRGADGAVLATFAKQAQELAGTSWRATGINNGTGGVASVVGGSAVTLRFGTDGRVSGSAGCNSFTGPYEAQGPSLRFPGPLATTRKLCPQEGVMAQEQAFLKALESVATARVEGNRLELRTADGALAGSFVRE